MQKIILVTVDTGDDDVDESDGYNALLDVLDTNPVVESYETTDGGLT